MFAMEWPWSVLYLSKLTVPNILQFSSSLEMHERSRDTVFIYGDVKYIDMSALYRCVYNSLETLQRYSFHFRVHDKISRIIHFYFDSLHIKYC